VDSLILARHGESVFSAELRMNGIVTVAGPLTQRGEEEAQALGAALAGESIDLCVTSEFERTRQTADVALTGRDVPRVVAPELNDPNYGSYEGQTLEEYRTWADSVTSGDAAPGGGESRRAIVSRYVRGFRSLLARDEATILVVAHSLPIAYVLAARDGDGPGRRVPLVEHAHPYRLTPDELERAVELLDRWLAAPTW
jgi:broad specificity phosphatase PhoE